MKPTKSLTEKYLSEGVKPPRWTWKKYLNSLTGKKRLLGLADYIEGLRWRGEDGERNIKKPRSFNMGRVVYLCNSPACIAGHAGYFCGADVGDFEGAAASWLGLDIHSTECRVLFYPLVYVASYVKGEHLTWYHKVTPEMAAKAIRRFARGERDPRKLWKEAL